MDLRNEVLEFWGKKGTFIEGYGWTYQREDIKLLLTKVKIKVALEVYNNLIDEYNWIHTDGEQKIHWSDLVKYFEKQVKDLKKVGRE